MPTSSSGNATTLSQTQQLEYLFKKISENKMKTDSSSFLKPSSELYASYPIIRTADIWMKSADLVAGPTNAGAQAVSSKKLLPMISVWGTTSPFTGQSSGNPSLRGQAWINYEGTLGSAIRITNWISS